MKAKLTGWLEIPLAYLSAADLAACCRELTVKPVVFDPREAPEPIHLYRKTPSVLKVPPAWGVSQVTQSWFDLSIQHATTTGTWTRPSLHKKLPDPSHALAPAGQAMFLKELTAAVKARCILLAESYTGSGKTAMLLHVAASLSHRTLVIVPGERLADQWEEAIVKHLGIPRGLIGRVQQDRCEYHRQIVIGIIHSVALRKYASEFYSAFGIVCWDEVHTVGAQMFSKTLGRFPAKYLIGLTATPTRKDGCAPVFLNYFGPPAVVNKAPALPTECMVVTYRGKRYSPRTPTRMLPRLLAGDAERNRFVGMWIHWLWQQKRTILVVSHSIEQLEELQRLCITSFGIPRGLLGQFTGEKTYGYKVDFPVVTSANRGKSYVLYSANRPFSKQTLVTCVRASGSGLVATVRYESGVRRGQWEELEVSRLRGLPVRKSIRRKMTLAEHDEVKRHATIIFATYGMFKQAQDVPRLDAGIDATPQSSATQVIGRIRRKVTGKRKPLWVTVRDAGTTALEKMLQARIRDYTSSNVSIKHYGKNS